MIWSGRQLADRRAHVACRNILRPAAVRPHAREQIGSDRQVAGFRKLVGHVLHPIGHAEDFVDDHNRGRFLPRLRVSQERFDGPAVVFYRDPFVPPRRFVHGLPRPILPAKRGHAQTGRGGAYSAPFQKPPS